MASGLKIILLCTLCSGANSFVAPTPSMRPTPSTRRGKPTQVLPPIWPYVGCDGCVGAGAAGLFVALVSTGFGLPVSEDVLLVSLGSRLGAMRPATVAAHCVAAVAGCALADVATVSLGCALRENEESLREQAPGFLGRLLRSIGRQLDKETRRDGARLFRDLEERLRGAVDGLKRLVSGDPPPPPPRDWMKMFVMRLRRLTCNTRTALARAGQAIQALMPLRNEDRDEGPAALGARLRASSGQRWPLALLAGLRGPLDRRKYALGAAAACVTMTLPAQLALGAIIGPSRRGIVALHVAVAWAQLCRQGPLWAAIAVAVKDEVGARRRLL